MAGMHAAVGEQPPGLVSPRLRAPLQRRTHVLRQRDVQQHLETTGRGTLTNRPTHLAEK